MRERGYRLEPLSFDELAENNRTDRERQFQRDYRRMLVSAIVGLGIFAYGGLQTTTALNPRTLQENRGALSNEEYFSNARKETLKGLGAITLGGLTAITPIFLFIRKYGAR